MNHKIFVIEVKNNFIKTAFIEKIKKDLIRINFNSIKIKSENGQSEILLYLINKYGLKQRPKIALSFGNANFIIRDLLLPATNQEEIESMLDFQISRLTPFAKDEVAFEYQKAYEDNNGYSQLIVMIIQKEKLNDLRLELKSYGLTIDKFYMNANAVLNTINYFKNSLGVLKGLDNYIFVDLDNLDSTIYAILNNKILFIRSIGLGINELNKSIINFKKELNATLAIIKDKFPIFEFQKIIFSGAIIDKEFNEKLRQSLGQNNIEFINFFSDSASQNFNYENQESKNNVSYLGLFGLFLNKQNINFSLIKKHRKISHPNLLRHAFSKTAILIYLLFGLSGLIFIGKFIERKNYLNEIEKRIKTIDEDSRINIKETFLMSQIKKEDLVDILIEFYNTIPDFIILDSLSYNYNQDFAIKAKAQNIKQINLLLTSFKNTRYFKNAQLKYAIKNKTDFGEKIEFQIDFYLKKK